MNILLIEDSEEKIGAVGECLACHIDEDQLELVIAKNLSDARRNILENHFDLIIFDIFLPIMASNPEEVEDVSGDLILEFSKSKNYQTETIAITQYKLADIQNIEEFNQYGIPVVSYTNDSKNWEVCLITKLEKIKLQLRYDFLIFCALTKERDAYAETKATLGSLKIVMGFNCQEISIAGFTGLCINPSAMGLVNMAITATKAIEYFQPCIVSMSGICAGVPGRSTFLDLIVADRCWEYQTGKFKDNEFKQEPYQVTISNILHTELTQFSSNSSLLTELKTGLYDTELQTSTIHIGPMSSGSAVVASQEKMLEIEQQHRKMLGLEMEMYAMYEAARHSLSQPLFFGVKSVVDMGDAAKGDLFHASASILSARFVVEFLESKLTSMTL